MANDDVVVSSEVVAATIAAFTKLDASADKRAMHKLARRLGKEQPALLQHAAAYKENHGDDVGEAAMFYSTLVWIMFDRQFAKTLPRLTQDNLQASRELIESELEKIADLSERPVHERYAESIAERQPHIYAKVKDLIDEDVKAEAITEECAGLIFTPTQVVIESFDAALEGRRPGERQGPVVRESPKVGRNDPCPCGSGKKYKRCHGGS